MAAYSANQLRACSSSADGKNFTGARRNPAPAKASARVFQRGSATMAILEILPPCKKRKSRSFPQSAPRSQPSKFSTITSKRGFDPMLILRAGGVLLCAKFASFQNAADAYHTDDVRLILDFHRQMRLLSYLAL